MSINPFREDPGFLKVVHMYKGAGFALLIYPIFS